jgi:formylglycine-generating enzyme required for sulfatase activity/tRNA A-37 threonylcarbamoyl transferase component Bud32
MNIPEVGNAETPDEGIRKWSPDTFRDPEPGDDGIRKWSPDTAYRLEDLLVGGGSAEVYRAVFRDCSGRIDVRKRVIKFFKKDLPKQHFLREVEVSKRLADAGAGWHIIRAETYGEDSVRGYWLAMEYGGDNLDKHLERSLESGTLPGSRDILEIARQLSVALRFLQTRGILHLDIKPSNILRDANGHLCLADFGSARISGGDESTGAGRVDKTLPYASPEHLTGDCDHRSDLYSLGATLLHLATGRMPAERELPTDDSHYRQIDSAAPDLRPLLRKLLHNDPAQRFQEAAEVLDAIESLEGRGGRPPEFLCAPFGESDAKEAIRRWARFLRRDSEHRHTISGLQFLLLSPGTFSMGAQDSADELKQKNVFVPADLRDHLKREQPAHFVTITKPVGFATTPVTRGQFRSFVRDTGYRVAERTLRGYDAEGNKCLDRRFTWYDPGFPARESDSDSHPVVNISWADISAFIHWLNRTESDRYVRYRLPTEAEWEYACRAGTTSMFCFGDSPTDIASYANGADRTYAILFRNYVPQHPGEADGFVFTSPVGSFKCNAFGLFDMPGNVWELCADGYDPNYYTSGPSHDPLSPPNGVHRVMRGGCWSSPPWELRSSMRGIWDPDQPYCKVGFRVACDYVSYGARIDLDTRQ